MENNAEQQPKVRKTSRRPDGGDLDRYKNLEKWSYRKWAWEFLRRNPVFIERCNALTESSSDEEKQSIADAFGLKKYKSYKESYVSASGRPIFVLGSIHSWSNLQENEGGQWKVPVNLEDGQVLIRFDLGSAINDSTVLDKQLRLAKTRLENRLKQYAAKMHREIGRGRHKVGTFGQYLRLLDLVASGKSDIDCSLSISPKNARRLADCREDKFSKEGLSSTMNKKIARAEEYSSILYRYLAVLKGKPNVKSVPLEK